MRLGLAFSALASRLVLFALFQGAVAAMMLQRGSAEPWADSVAWWPASATLANLISLAVLRRLLALEGRRYRDLLRFEGGTVRRDVLTSLGLLVVGGVLAMASNLGLAALLWGDPEAPLATFVQPLPLWGGLVALVAFPITVALSELPTYYAYARPRLEAAGLAPWLALGAAALFHGLQHATLPLVFDGTFIAWRALMFLPFALFVGAALRWRPHLLPYLMIAHALLDASVGVMVLQAPLP
jgi:hypothetical protein